MSINNGKNVASEVAATTHTKKMNIAKIQNPDEAINEQISDVLKKSPDSLEEKILKVSILQKKISERATLIKHKERISSFKLSDFEYKDSLVIRTSFGDEYTISSATLTKEVLEVMKAKISSKILEVEKEIQF